MENIKVQDNLEAYETNIINVIKEVSNTLEEKGYNSLEQLVGYLMSGDPGYISSYKGARQKIVKLDRTCILELLVKGIIK